MAARSNCLLIVIGLFCLLANACSVIRPPSITRIALLAPFEGRYRAVGYNAFYAARLALQDAGISNVELLAIDDGGLESSAVQRARALNNDPLVKVIIGVGFAANSSPVQEVANKPLLIVGNWNAVPTNENTFILSHSVSIPAENNIPAISDEAPLTNTNSSIVGDVYALEPFASLNQEAQSITVVSSASLPSDDFVQRYIHSAEFAPEPNLLATLTYDATRIALTAVMSSTTNVADALRQLTYRGLNGDIAFEAGYWVDAPIYCYEFDANDALVTINCPVE